MDGLDVDLQRVRTLGGTRWAGGNVGPVAPSAGEVLIARQSAQLVAPDTIDYASIAFRLLDPNNDGVLRQDDFIK